VRQKNFHGSVPRDVVFIATVEQKDLNTHLSIDSCSRES